MKQSSASPIYWHLRLYPKGQLNLTGSDEHSTGLYLHLAPNQRDELLVKFKFCLLDASGRVVYSPPHIVHRYGKLAKHCGGFGYPSFIQHSQLLNSEGFLTDGTLSIRCQLEYQVECNETW